MFPQRTRRLHIECALVWVFQKIVEFDARAAAALASFVEAAEGRAGEVGGWRCWFPAHVDGDEEVDDVLKCFLELWCREGDLEVLEGLVEAFEVGKVDVQEGFGGGSAGGGPHVSEEGVFFGAEAHCDADPDEVCDPFSLYQPLFLRGEVGGVGRGDDVVLIGPCGYASDFDCWDG